MATTLDRLIYNMASTAITSMMNEARIRKRMEEQNFGASLWHIIRTADDNPKEAKDALLAITGSEDIESALKKVESLYGGRYKALGDLAVESIETAEKEFDSIARSLSSTTRKIRRQAEALSDSGYKDLGEFYMAVADYYSTVPPSRTAAERALAYYDSLVSLIAKSQDESLLKKATEQQLQELEEGVEDLSRDTRIDTAVWTSLGRFSLKDPHKPIIGLSELITRGDVYDMFRDYLEKEKKEKQKDGLPTLRYDRTLAEISRLKKNPYDVVAIKNIDAELFSSFLKSMGKREFNRQYKNLFGEVSDSAYPTMATAISSWIHNLQEFIDKANIYYSIIDDPRKTASWLGVYNEAGKIYLKDDWWKNANLNELPENIRELVKNRDSGIVSFGSIDEAFSTLSGIRNYLPIEAPTEAETGPKPGSFGGTYGWWYWEEPKRSLVPAEQESVSIGDLIQSGKYGREQLKGTLSIMDMFRAGRK